MATSMSTSAFATQCLGRFTIELPVLPLRGRADTVQGVNVTVIEDAREVPDRLWEQRLVDLHALRAPPGQTSAVLRILDQPDGFATVVYVGNEFEPDTIYLETARLLASQLLVFTATAPRGEEQTGIGQLAAVVAALHSFPAGILPTSRAYCLRAGAVFLPAAGPEGSVLTMESDNARTRLVITINTVSRPRSINREPEYGVIESEFDKFGLQPERLRLGPRRIGTLYGFEAAHKLVDHGRQVFSGSWSFPGLPAYHSEEPFVSIQAKWPYGPETLEEWDRILSSLRSNSPSMR